MTSISTRVGLRAALLLSVLPALLAPAARADVFSPGELARAHEKLEGLQNCTKCHAAGQQLSPETCLDCHVELKGRVAAGKGFHGRMPPAERACQTCHHEHQGRDFALVSWGKGGEKGFDHAKTGYALEGKHRPVDCAKCHDPRLVTDAGVKELLAKQPNRKTRLGAPTACNACHFDEHRGQLGPTGADCARCHQVEGWKPAKGFDHAKTAYKLDGKHVKVECAKCHKPQQEEGPRAVPPGFTAPKNTLVFARYKPLPFQACTDCHKDPHLGRFGPACASCHVTADWKQLTGAGAQKAFHEKTRYPLRGGHLVATCESCHGPYPALGQPAKYKNMTFGKCTDCHADAHAGQLGRAGAARTLAAGKTCDRCHAVEAATFAPPRFELADHDQLDYKLEGAHRTVACGLCHPKDPRLATRFPAAVKAELEKKRRKVLASAALYEIPKSGDCRTCHRDPHKGQFDARMAKAPAQGCQACHGLEDWKKLRFDHARDSSYPLTGKHEKAACASCHRPAADGVVRYKPLAAACATCHADVHLGQLAVKGQGTDCARCHGTAGWKEPLLFKHDKPFTAYRLEGKHAKVACEKCHAAVPVNGVPVRRYKPLPTACEGCHADFHKGAFKGYVP